MPKVSLFHKANAIHNPRVAELDHVLAAVKDGKWEGLITELRGLEGAAFQEKKKLLPGFTVSGTFAERNDAGLLELSGFIQCDVDGKENPSMKFSELREIVIGCPSVYAAFRSPSGKGIKAIIKCGVDRDAHAGSHAAIVQYLADRGVVVDDRVCALSQLCFVSADPKLYLNPGAVAITPVEVSAGTPTALVEYEESRTDEEIIEACASAWPDVFPLLWAGEVPGGDPSTADHQLISILRENCFSNDRVVALFEQSGLYRADKWKGNTHGYVMRSLAKCSAVQALSLFSEIEEDLDDPSPSLKRNRKGVWAWQTAADIPEWQPEDDKYIIKRLLYESTVSCIYGAPGSGKTFCIFSMAAAVATGTEWQGHKVRQGAVLYFGLEGHNGVIKRIQAMKKEGHLTEDAPFARVECKEDAMNLLEDDHVKKARDTVAAYEAECGFKVKMLIIDTLARATPGGDENSTKDMGVAVINSNLIAVQTGCAVVIVHHSGKEVSKGMRGSTALPAAFDSTYEVSRLEDDHSIRVFTVKKQRDESDAAALYFKLQIVTLGVDADGEAVTTCILRFLEPAEIPVKKEKGQVEMENLVSVIPEGGCDLDQLESLSGLSRTTLQRRLKAAVESGLARRTAEGRVYKVNEDPTIDL